MDRREVTIFDWIQGFRPQTLGVTLPPILVGTYLESSGKEVNLLLALSLWATIVFLQTGTNLTNDAVDFTKGVDGSARKGHKRWVMKGLLTEEATRKWAFFFFGLAVAMALPLIMAGHSFVAIWLALGIFFGYGYTGGPLPSSYMGYSEIVVFLFYGPIATISAAYLQRESIALLTILASIQVGLFSALPLVINNVRDIQEDIHAGKKTLVARFGLSFGKKEIAFFAAIPFFLQLGYLFLGKGFIFTLPMMLLPFAFCLVKKVYETSPSEKYNRFLVGSAMLGILFSLLLALGGAIG